MTIALWAVGAYCILAAAAHLGSIVIVARRCRKGGRIPALTERKTALGVLGLTRFLRRRGLHLGKERLRSVASAALAAPGVSLVRPICGLENHIEETLESAFHLDYPRYEIIFCAAAASDSACALVRRLIADHPHVPARLLIGNDAISANPKLNNVCKGWRAAAHDWIVIADSNVLMPRDYIERLLAAWRTDTGLVCSPPVGCRPDGFWAELECAFLNTYQARWQYVADSDRPRFCPGQDDALAAQSDRGRRRHPRCWQPNRRRMPPSPSSCAPPACACVSSMRRSRNRSATAPRPRCGRRQAALGAAAAAHRSSASTRRKGLAGGLLPLIAAAFVCGALDWPVGGRRRARGDVGMAPRSRLRSAPDGTCRALPARLDAARHAVAVAVDRRLARPRFRLARQCKCAAVESREHDLDRSPSVRRTSGQRAGATVYNSAPSPLPPNNRNLPWISELPAARPSSAPRAAGSAAPARARWRRPAARWSSTAATARRWSDRRRTAQGDRRQGDRGAGRRRHRRGPGGAARAPARSPTSW